MPEKFKVMLVDDEESIRRVVEQILIKDGYQFCYACNGETALKTFKREKPSLLILDVMLPEMDGFELCRIIRMDSPVPIIMLSAKGDIVDKSVGFNMGADDYIAKPFSPVELSLRIKALLRRTAHFTNYEQTMDHPNIFKIKDLEINCKHYEVKIRGQKAELTSKEFELLCFMAHNPGQVFTREQLFNILWGEDYVGDTGSITVFIRKIREKIEEEPARPQYIVTVWGVGYKFCSID
ncbi:DNA-binding response regulator [Dehalobacter sp. MCB1]|uniref:response regulator transcription factor n=1 Tax=unclassified Dehalobacter TaxID=2635733 RepID=UPI000E6C8FA3|nr:MULTISPECIES: response regulator transcription factor [unclassified Dehalobacter]RJE47269.1 DNA-binding response regulator [Dehalobacter sp. MCB1]TCX54877.1 DNA-binding response regulator [Dehalobacter sp. 12DCB1]